MNEILYIILIILALLGWAAFVHLYFEIKNIRDVISYIEKKIEDKSRLK